MLEPFHFFAESGLVVHSNYMADSLKSLLRGLRKVPDASIFCHLHYALLRWHFAASDHMNDFAQWAMMMGQRSLGERLASVDPVTFRSIREARDRLIAYVSEYVTQSEMYLRMPEGQEFHFLEFHSTILPMRRHAVDLRSFHDALSRASMGVIFFHMIEAPLRLGKTSNDFSEWLENTLSEQDLAREIAQLNPYVYNLWELKAEILSLVKRRLMR